MWDGMSETHGSERKLDELFSAYRQAMPDPEGDKLFMPRLWEKIEGRRRFGHQLGRLARGLVTAAAAVTAAMALYLGNPAATAPATPSTYVEVLNNEDDSPEQLALVDFDSAENPYDRGTR